MTPTRESPSSWMSKKNTAASSPQPPSSPTTSSSSSATSELVIASFYVETNGDIKRRRELSWCDEDPANKSEFASSSSSSPLPLPFYSFAEARESQPFTYFEKFDAFFGALMLDRIYLLLADEVTTAVTFPFAPQMTPLRHRLVSNNNTTSTKASTIGIVPFVGGVHNSHDGVIPSTATTTDMSVAPSEETIVKRIKSTLWVGVPIRGGIPIPAAPKNELGRLEAFFPGPKGGTSASSLLTQYYSDWFAQPEATADYLDAKEGDASTTPNLPTGSQRSPFVPMLNATRQNSTSRRSTTTTNVRIPDGPPPPTRTSSSSTTTQPSVSAGDGIVHFVSFLRSDHLSDGTCYYSDDVDLTIAFPFANPTTSHSHISAAAKRGVPAPLLDCDWNAHLRKPFSSNMTLTNPLHKTTSSTTSSPTSATPPVMTPKTTNDNDDDDEWGDFSKNPNEPTTDTTPATTATTSSHKLAAGVSIDNSNKYTKKSPSEVSAFFDSANVCESVLPKLLFEGEVCAKLIRGFCGSEKILLNIDHLKSSSAKKQRALRNVQLELQNADGSPLRDVRKRRSSSTTRTTYSVNNNSTQPITVHVVPAQQQSGGGDLDTFLNNTSSQVASRAAMSNPIGSAAQAVVNAGTITTDTTNKAEDEYGDFFGAPSPPSPASNPMDLNSSASSTPQMQSLSSSIPTATSARPNQPTPSFEKDLHIALIGRQSVTNPGPRYLSRGLNHLYGVGNDHVYELVMWRQVSTENHPNPSSTTNNKTSASPPSCRCYRFARHTFLRGTIPVNWSTNVSKYSLEAKMVFPTNPDDIKRGSVEYLGEVLRKMDGTLFNDITAAFASLSTSLTLPGGSTTTTTTSSSKLPTSKRPSVIASSASSPNGGEVAVDAAAAAVASEWTRLLSQYESLRSAARVRCINLLRLDGTADEDILSFHFKRAVDDANVELLSEQRQNRQHAITQFFDRLKQSNVSSSSFASSLAGKRVEAFMREVLLVEQQQEDSSAKTTTSTTATIVPPPRVDFQNVDWLSTVKNCGLEYALDVLWGATVPFMLEADRQFRLPVELDVNPSTSKSSATNTSSPSVSVNSAASARFLAHLPYTNRCAAAVLYGTAASTSLDDSHNDLTTSPSQSSYQHLHQPRVAGSLELKYVRQRLSELKVEPLIFTEVGQEVENDEQHQKSPNKCTLEDAYVMYRNAPKSGMATTGFLSVGCGSSAPNTTSSLSYSVDAYQTNFVRVNCADSLDRTNLSCFFVNQQASLEMLRLMGVTSDDIVSQDPPRDAVFDSGDSSSQREGAVRAIQDRQLRAKRNPNATIPIGTTSTTASGAVVGGIPSGKVAVGSVVSSGVNSHSSASHTAMTPTTAPIPHVAVKFNEGLTWDSLEADLKGSHPPIGTYRYPLMSNFGDFSRNVDYYTRPLHPQFAAKSPRTSPSRTGATTQHHRDPTSSTVGASSSGGLKRQNSQHSITSSSASAPTRRHQRNNTDRNSYVICPYALLRSLCDLFLLNGDTIATSYTNTGAMHTQMIRGFLGRSGSSQSGVMISAQRRLENLFIDKRKFRLIEAVLGRNHSDHFPSFCSGPFSVQKTSENLWNFSFTVGGLPANCTETQIMNGLRHAWQTRTERIPSLEVAFGGLTVAISPETKTSISIETQRGLYRLRLKLISKLNALRKLSIHSLQAAIKTSTQTMDVALSRQILESARDLIFQRYEVVMTLLGRLFQKFDLPLPLKTPETGAFGTSYVYHLPPTLLTNMASQNNAHNDHMAAAERMLLDRIEVLLTTNRHDNRRRSSSRSAAAAPPRPHTPGVLSEGSSAAQTPTNRPLSSSVLSGEEGPLSNNTVVEIAVSNSSFDPFDFPADSVPRLSNGLSMAPSAVGGSGYGAAGGAAKTPARTILPSALSVRDLPELPSLPPTVSSPRTHRPTPTTTTTVTPSKLNQQPPYPKCNDVSNAVDDDCAFSEDDLVGSVSSSASDEDDCNFDRCAGDDGSHQRLPYNCMMSDPHSATATPNTIGGASSPLPATPISEAPLPQQPAKPLLDSFDIVGNNSFIPGNGEDMASAAAAACATLNLQQSNVNIGSADSDQLYEASYTSFKTDEIMMLDEDMGTDMEISKHGFDSGDRGGGGGGGCVGAEIASDGDFQDAAVDHCAVVTVRHRETIRHDSQSVRGVVVSQFLKLQNIDLYTYMDGSPFGWGKVSAGIDSIFTAVSSTATGADVINVLDTILRTESTKIDRYLLLEHAYGVSKPTPPTSSSSSTTGTVVKNNITNNNNTAALTLEAQEGTMVHRCHISDYKYVIDSRSTHQGARRMQESNGATSGTYTHGMLREELERKSNHNSNGEGGSGGGSGGHSSSSGGRSGGGSIIAGTASKLFGFVRKAI